jgi:tetratricopeptide (TPR) repeat protein
MSYLQAIYFRSKWYSIGEAVGPAIKQLNRGSFQAVVDICDLILAKAPDHATAYFYRAVALQNMREFDEGLANFDKAIALKPDYAEAYFNRGITLDNMLRIDDALASYDKALALNPGYAEAYYTRGKALGIKGDLQEAEKMYVKALSLRPDLDAAWANLTDIRKYRDADHPDIKSIQTLLGKPNVSQASRGQLYFALAKIYDDCGLYDEAFEFYRQANQICSTTVSYNAGEVTKMTDRIMDVFSQEFLARRSVFASDNRSPLFVVGMPRSGTTLIASILSNHRSIATAGEVETINEFTLGLVKSAETGVPYPEEIKQIAPSIALRLIEDYLKRVRRDLDADASYVIDKNPINFKHLGLIAKLFPNARVIHCTRNPMDTCLSNYFQRFSTNCDHSFDLRNIGHFFGEYARLMEHWKKVLPLELIEISYEDMVVSTEKIAGQALNWLGLEWDEQCLAPHKNPCEVGTASYWQVRQPIYKHSLERWRRYERHLAPLKETLHQGSIRFSGELEPDRLSGGPQR